MYVEDLYEYDPSSYKFGSKKTARSFSVEKGEEFLRNWNMTKRAVKQRGHAFGYAIDAWLEALRDEYDPELEEKPFMEWAAARLHVGKDILVRYTRGFSWPVTEEGWDILCDDFPSLSKYRDLVDYIPEEMMLVPFDEATNWQEAFWACCRAMLLTDDLAAYALNETKKRMIAEGRYTAKDAEKDITFQSVTLWRLGSNNPVKDNWDLIVELLPQMAKWRPEVVSDSPVPNNCSGKKYGNHPRFER